MKRVIAVVLGIMCVGSVFATRTPDAQGGSRSGEVEILMLSCAPAGINYNLIRDVMNLHGWNVTVAGLSGTVNLCAYGGAITTDVLISDVTDLSPYDCLAIMPSRAYTGVSHEPFLNSPETLALVAQAVDEGLLVAAFCGGTRVLAAADVIDGLTVTGHPTYAQEYIDAGATYIEGPVPPILDGTILTTRRGQTYSRRVCEVMRTAIDGLRAAKAQE